MKFEDTPRNYALKIYVLSTYAIATTTVTAQTA